MAESSILDDRLAEIDRRLSTIQTGLQTPGRSEPARLRPVPESADAPVEAPAETIEPPADASAEAAGAESVARDGLLADLRELRAAHERLLELHRDLLTQYAELLERRADAAAVITLDAGPFAAADDVRAFERTLGALPGVRAVAVREYRDGDRVGLRVELAG